MASAHQQPRGSAASPPSDSMNPSNDGERKNPNHQPEWTICHIHGVEMPVQQTYDPNTYDPEAPTPWTPEPEPYEPDTYAAWGRKHFGEDWYEQRRIMLQERNIYSFALDPVYTSRQRALRVMEHKIEGRPFRARDGTDDKGWKRVWARLSKTLPSAQDPPSPNPDNNSNDGSEQSDASGDTTLPPTPGRPEYSPPPTNPWEALEWQRKHFGYDEETYQCSKFFLKDSIIDSERGKRETELGDRKAHEELEAIRDLRWAGDMEKYEVERAKYDRRVEDADLRGKGWTEEQIEAAHRADAAFDKWIWENQLEFPLDEYEKQETSAKLRIYGGLPPSQPDGVAGDYDAWRRNIHDRISKQNEQEQEQETANVTSATSATRAAEATGVTASAPKKALQPQASIHPVTKNNSSRKTLGGKITKSKTRKPERASRRLAGQPPEHSMLPTPAPHKRKRASSREVILVKGAKP